MSNYYIPNYILEYYIYDIFYNDDNEIIIISAPEIEPFKIEYYDINNTLQIFKLYKCPHNHTYIYTLKTNFRQNIKLIIDGVINEIQINKYPIFNNEIIFSTIVKDENKYIKQWIDFHFNLGVSRFIIYDNSDNETLSILLKKYILNKIVVLIKWSYPYRLPISGISGQTTQQNHSIYAFKNSKYIGLFDIDEYVNIQKKINIADFFNELILSENIDIKSISTFRLLNKFFYNPFNLPTKENKFLNIFTCDSITDCGHEKNFAIPKNITTFSVHMVTDGLPMYTVNSSLIYFNHYYFLNKNDRGKNMTNNIDKTILLHI
jgi:hypothetical protein